MSLGRANIGRFEYKYAVPLALRDRLVELATPYVTPDPHGQPLPGGGLGYAVHSIYYDTFDQAGHPTLLDYFERLDSHRVRDRLRVRTYGAAGDTHQPVFLENKRKQNNRVVKARVRICNTREWFSATTNRPWREFADRIRGRKKMAYTNFDTLIQHRQPVSVVHYEREVFVARSPKHPRVRMTIDRDVCATTRPSTLDPYAPADVDLIPRDWVVLELKFDSDRPHWMRTLVQTLRLHAVPVSKFGLSVLLGYRADQPREIRFFTPTPLRRLGRLAGQSAESAS